MAQIVQENKIGHPTMRSVLKDDDDDDHDDVSFINMVRMTHITYKCDEHVFLTSVMTIVQWGYLFTSPIFNLVLSIVYVTIVPLSHWSKQSLKFTGFSLFSDPKTFNMIKLIKSSWQSNPF